METMTTSTAMEPAREIEKIEDVIRATPKLPPDEPIPELEQGRGGEVPCCDYKYDGGDYPVKWNPWNKVVQCHNCGQVWAPAPAAPADVVMVPVDVMRAAERMSQPLHESRLSGMTAQEDARCSMLVLSFLRGLAAAKPE